MKRKIQKWGNSLALRIPHAFAAEAEVAYGSAVELELKEGSLVITPLARRPSLASLLSGVTDANIHREIDSGEPQGGEVW
jgi:antitoxin MazE